jgi:hypothetical protein
LQVRCNDEVETQCRRWTFYETIIFKDFIDLIRVTGLLFAKAFA